MGEVHVGRAGAGGVGGCAGPEQRPAPAARRAAVGEASRRQAVAPAAARVDDSQGCTAGLSWGEHATPLNDHDVGYRSTALANPCGSVRVCGVEGVKICEAAAGGAVGEGHVACVARFHVGLARVALGKVKGVLSAVVERVCGGEMAKRLWLWLWLWLWCARVVAGRGDAHGGNYRWAGLAAALAIRGGRKVAKEDLVLVLVLVLLVRLLVVVGVGVGVGVAAVVVGGGVIIAIHTRDGDGWDGHGR